MILPNSQAPEQRIETSYLDVHSIFYTIQGEGPFAGRPAVFIRLAGCNLQCPLCDTDYTSKRRSYELGDLMDEVQEELGPLLGSFPRLYASRPLVVITGGEPLRQNIYPLVSALLEHGAAVQIETNGTSPLWPTKLAALAYTSGARFSVVCSPKARVHPELWQHITAVKYVVHADDMDPEDGLPVRALSHPVAKRVSRPPLGWTGHIYVQPVDVQDPHENQRHMQAAVQSCMEHGYIMCLQTHKILGLE